MSTTTETLQVTVAAGPTSRLEPVPKARIDAALEIEAPAKPHLSSWRRSLIVFIAGWNALVSTSASTSLLIATPEVAAELNTSQNTLNITNAGFLIAMACSALLWLPLANITSRRLSYNLALVVMAIGSIGTATAPDLGTFTAMRLLSGLTGAYVLVAGQTIVFDIFSPTNRAKAIGRLSIGAICGTWLGPCIGGILLTFTHNWRNINYLQCGQAGLGLILSLLFVPHIQSDVVQIHEKNRGKKLSVTGVARAFSPMFIFKLYLKPQLLLTDFVCGFLALTQYAMATSVRHTINPTFNLTTPLVGGLFYLAPGAGFMIGGLLGGYLSDLTVERWIVKRNGLRLPKDRLNCILPHLFATLPISELLYGWALHKGFGSLALPVVMAVLMGVGIEGSFAGLNTYTGEVLPNQKAGAVCTRLLLQYTSAGISIAAAVPIIDQIGIGWLMTLTASLKVVGGCIVLLVSRFAPDTGVWAYKEE